MLQDTISAVSSPRGKGGVAVIRISGSNALQIADRMFLPFGPLPLQATPRKARLGSLLAPTASIDWSPVDQGLALYFPSPASFTGEDVIEFHCHGGALLTETLLGATFAAGARPATAGEFTRRAFLNGKLKLHQAEALGLMLEAETEEQLLLASSGLRENSPLTKALNALYDDLVLLLSTAYARIDYPDEDLADLSPEEVLTSLQKISTALSALLKSFRTGHAVVEGIQTTICGRPNVGKSSIYNRLIGENKAIVTDIPGTTRDILEHTAQCGEVLLRLSDTAGIRDLQSADPVEQIGIEKARQKLADAELILAVFDGSEALTDVDTALIASLKATLTDNPRAYLLFVLNKSDKPAAVSPEQLNQAFGKAVPCVAVSAQSGEGWSNLVSLIQKTFLEGHLDLSQNAIIMNARQNACLVSALEAVRRAEKSLSLGFTFDIVSSDLEEALESIRQVDGRSVNEDIVSSIFAHFCVGK